MLIQGEAARTQHWYGSRDDLFSVYNKYLTGSIEKTKPDSSQWCLLTGEQATGRSWNVRNSFWRKHFFFFFLISGVFEYWNKLMRKALESSSLEIFEAQLDIALGNQLVADLALSRGLDSTVSRSPFPPQILCGFVVAIMTSSGQHEKNSSSVVLGFSFIRSHPMFLRDSYYSDCSWRTCLRREGQ